MICEFKHRMPGLLCCFLMPLAASAQFVDMLAASRRNKIALLTTYDLF